MRSIRFTIGALALATTMVAFTVNVLSSKNPNLISAKAEKQTINMFVTHGHCSTPFGATVSDLKITAPLPEDAGNPLEHMQVSFAIDPHTFRACHGDEFTQGLQTPGLFVDDENQKLVFKSTQVYTMGVDWYQVNGYLSIKGVERDVKFFVTGIRNPEEQMPKTLILEGRLNLLDWGIDYDKIVNGDSQSALINPTKWMHLNMRVDLG